MAVGLQELRLALSHQQSQAVGRGTYTLVVSNTFGAVSNAVPLWPSPRPVITIQTGGRDADSRGQKTWFCGFRRRRDDRLTTALSMDGRDALVPGRPADSHIPANPVASVTNLFTRCRSQRFGVVFSSPRRFRSCSIPAICFSPGRNL